MTWTVSVGDLRNNLADYLERVRQGDNLVIKDERKNEDIAQITAKKQFDSEAFLKALDQFAGSVSAKDHPEWATRNKIDRWLRAVRRASDRRIYVLA